MNDLVWLLIAAGLMLPGLIGVLIPVLPGIPLMFLVALLFGFINRFTALTPGELGILFIIALASIVVDYLAGVLGAKYSGASAKALGAGVLGMIIGLIVLPPLGSFIGLFIGVLLVELRHRTEREALKAATGSLIGTLAGMAINLILALLFIGLFLTFGWK